MTETRIELVQEQVIPQRNSSWITWPFASLIVANRLNYHPIQRTVEHK